MISTITAHCGIWHGIVSQKYIPLAAIPKSIRVVNKEKKNVRID